MKERFKTEKITLDNIDEFLADVRLDSFLEATLKMLEGKKKQEEERLRKEQIEVDRNDGRLMLYKPVSESFHSSLAFNLSHTLKSIKYMLSHWNREDWYDKQFSHLEKLNNAVNTAASFQSAVVRCIEELEREKEISFASDLLRVLAVNIQKYGPQLSQTEMNKILDCASEIQEFCEKLLTDRNVVLVMKAERQSLLQKEPQEAKVIVSGSKEHEAVLAEYGLNGILKTLNILGMAIVNPENMKDNTRL